MARKTKATSTPQSANGALPAAETTAAPAPRKASSKAVSAHQTHGAYTPASGPITSANQLYRLRSVTRNALTAFASMEEYTGYLKGLTDGEIHRHAAEDARIVPIDDRGRLIRRLQEEWSRATAFQKEAPKRPGFTPEQVAAQKALRDQMLSRGTLR